jgi:hypothetical protein
VDKGVCAKQLEQDSWDRAAHSWDRAAHSQDRTAGIGQLGQDSRDKTTRTGQPGQKNWDRKARENRQVRTTRIGNRGGTARI